MNRYTWRGLFALTLAIWALASLTPSPAGYADEPIPAITAADCGPAPKTMNRDAWYAYGDCQGDYGPIDAAE